MVTYAGLEIGNSEDEKNFQYVGMVNLKKTSHTLIISFNNQNKSITLWDDNIYNDCFSYADFSKFDNKILWEIQFNSRKVDKQNLVQFIKAIHDRNLVYSDFDQFYVKPLNELA